MQRQIWKSTNKLQTKLFRGGENKMPWPSPAPYTRNIMQERALKMGMKGSGTAPSPPTHRRQIEKKMVGPIDTLSSN